jgi:hypothetical protein
MMKRLRIIRHFKKHRALYYRAAPLLVLALIVAGLAVQSVQPFKSVEVAFTDAAPSGLAIVPASCPSSPDTNSCKCGPKPTQTCNYTWVTNAGGRGGSYACSSYTYSCPAGYTYDGYWCVLKGSSCSVSTGIGPPTVTLTADRSSIQVGDTDGIRANFAPASGDTLHGSSINEVPPSSVNLGTGYGQEAIALDSGYFADNNPSSPNAQSSLVYSFRPTTPGSYTFLTFYSTAQYPYAAGTLSTMLPQSQWVTVVVTPATCANGSAAPNDDPSQCSCAQGNQSACKNGGNNTCPDGSAAPNGDPNQCTCVHGNQSACSICPTGDSCTACVSGSGSTCVCPLGYSLENGQCVFTTCPAGYTAMTVNGVLECDKSSCTPHLTCDTDGNLHQVSSSCDVSTTVAQTCGNGCTGDICNAPPSPSVLNFSVVPVLVQSGKTTQVSWTVQGATDCSVKGSNGDGANGTWAGLTSPAGGMQSSPITSQTIYTLHCSVLPGAQNADGSPAVWTDEYATVNVVPGFNEQ